MKKYLSIISALMLLIAGLVWAADNTYTTGFYVQQGADRAVVASGGSLDVESGGEINIESGASLKLNGTAIITAPTVTSLDTTWAVSSHEYTTTADWEMSGTEAKSLLLTLTSGDGAGDRNIIAPDVSGRLYIVRNDTTAGGSAVIKKSGGTGVSIASGKTATVIHNGSDYIRVTADQTH